MLTAKELELMQILWDADRALTAAEIIKLSPNKTWKSASVHNIINTLLRKQIISEGESVQTVKSYARTFFPIIEKEDYLLQCFHEQKLFSEKSFPKILTAMVEYTSDKQILSRLEDILNNRGDKKK